MRIVTSIDKLLHTISGWPGQSTASPGIVTGLPAIDSLLPAGGFATRSVHEVLGTTGFPSVILPVLVARAAAKTGWIVWCDFARRFYPPGAIAMGLELDRLLLLRPKTQADELWAATECLHSAGVAVCIVAPPRLTVVQARRLQLAAERGGGVGLVLRSADAISRPYAAATRWLVSPAPGERTSQCWRMELIHGHGGLIGQSVLLEVCRETYHVRAVSPVVGRSGETKTTAASA